jgi:hypothetical protein
VPRKAGLLLVQPRKEARHSVEQVECRSQGKGQPSPLGCDPGNSRNEMVLAIVATDIMKAYIVSSDDVFRRKDKNGQIKREGGGELHQQLLHQPHGDI